MAVYYLLLIGVAVGVVMSDEMPVALEERESTPWTIEKQLLTLKATVAEQNTKLCEMEKDLLKMSQQISDITQQHNSDSDSKKNGEENGDNDADDNSSRDTKSAEINKIASMRTIFTVWGKNECPSNVSEQVYSGFAGGSLYSHKGGAAEYVCLPPDPTWGPYKNVAAKYLGFMYGAEYQELPDTSLLDGKVPCTVCLTTSFAVSMMIPARRSCYPGWTEAYHGELSSGYHSHDAASQYVCLAEHPYKVPRVDNRSQNGKLFYPVRSVCGSLPCPPYENNKLLSCVVCLK